MYQNLPEGYARNEKACEECKRYADDKPLGPRCRKFNAPAQPTDHALYQTWDPCFEAKGG